MVEIYDLKATNKELQNQFNDLYIPAKETEKSLNWEKHIQH
jgi:hypothetical protein